ncbi:hypothetical protein Pint_10695 [Pistacia integerrima]|uniref:Uncharacterized protein n=1 Tax=Pistacia integerrima TaxID=434235 RepID=A0ACC0XNZ5_9ROSI|nr:hypothetical protein Pint_10695 [Pistacia integerrima]
MGGGENSYHIYNYSFSAWAPIGAPLNNVQREDHWRHFDNSVNAVSFGFVATAILISMFLVMAIFERFLRPTSPTGNHTHGDLESQLPFNPKLGYPSPKFKDFPCCFEYFELSLFHFFTKLTETLSMQTDPPLYMMAICLITDDYVAIACPVPGVRDRSKSLDTLHLLCEFVTHVQWTLNSDRMFPKSVGGLSMTVYANGVSVLMPGDDIPTFIAHPAPVPCPPERISWPHHQHHPLFNSTTNSNSNSSSIQED